MKQILFLVLLISFIQLSAQSERKYIITSDIGYNYTHNDEFDLNSLNYHSFGEKMNQMTFGISVGRKLKSNFYYGLGISYFKSKNEINPESDIPDINESSGYVTLTSYNNTITKISVASPYLYFQYFTDFSERVAISIDIYSRYDFSNERTSYTEYSLNTFNLYESSREQKTETKKQFLALGIQPSVRFTLIKNFGIAFKFGVMEYKIKTYDSRKEDNDKTTSSFKIGFKPENWLIGFYLKI